MTSLNKIHLAFLFMFAIVWNHCFNYIGLKPYLTVFQSIAILFTVYIIVTCFHEIFSRRHKIITALYILLCATFLTSVFYWKQPVLQTYVAFLPSFAILIYFYLHRQKVGIHTVEMFMVMMAAVYLICWLYQLVSLPDLIFGIDRDGILGKEVRGFYRFWIPNKEHLPFLIFFFLKMYHIKRRPIYLILSAVIFFIVILHVTRQVIFWSALCTVLYYLSEHRKNLKSIVLSCTIVFLGITVIVNKSTVAKELLKITQQENVMQNTRFKAIRYFLKEYSKDPFTIATGNGFATKGSNLAQKITNEQKKRYYRSDVGFIGMFCDTGLGSVVLYIILMFYILKLDVSPEYTYLKYYILYMYGTFLMGHALTSNLLFMMSALYVSEVSTVPNLIAKIKMCCPAIK